MATIGFAGAVALASSIALGGCFGLFIPTERDPCKAAENHLVECMITAVGEGTSGEQPACSGALQCNADCINKADCTQLQDAFGGMPSATSKPFLDCAQACAVAQ